MGDFQGSGHGCKACSLTAGDEMLDKHCPWPCLICNASESCSSWEILVTVLLTAEKVSVTIIMQLEKMFSNSGAVDTDDVGSPTKVDGTRSLTNCDSVESPEALKAENLRLLRENEELHHELGEVR